MLQQSKSETFTASDEEKRNIRQSAFFGSLPPAIFDVILSGSRSVPFASGDVLFHHGDEASEIYCVLRGLVKLSIGQPDGRDVVIEVFQPGQSFAEALAFRAGVYPATATALVDSVVLAVPIDVIQTTVLDRPETTQAVLAGTFVHLHKLVSQIESLKANSGQARLLQYILAASNGERSASIEIPFEKQVLASLLGITPETLSRLFRGLQAHGVTVQKRKILVQDREKLKKFSLSAL